MKHVFGAEGLCVYVWERHGWEGRGQTATGTLRDTGVTSSAWAGRPGDRSQQ